MRQTGFIEACFEKRVHKYIFAVKKGEHKDFKVQATE